MGTSVERPLAVAHGGYFSRSEEGRDDLARVTAAPTDSERSDPLSLPCHQDGTISCRKNMHDQLSVRTYTRGRRKLLH
jgi:hypothetical protein